jgi:1-deoxy-D-xylulose-5-phosphate reductoisomerase
MGKISILGSTGSLGRAALAAAADLDLSIFGLAAGSNVETLATQIARFNPTVVSLATEYARDRLAADLTQRGIKAPQLEWGKRGLCAVAAGGQAVVVAVGGMACLDACLETLARAARLVVGSKELAVSAGSLFMQCAARNGAVCVPLDSELTALARLLCEVDRRQIRRCFLTASGGPLWSRRTVDFKTVTPQIATAHPVWSMGPKISVDSATLMNKAMELLAAHTMLTVPAERIQIVVHPQCYVHAAIELNDGTVRAHIAAPDMRWAVAEALGLCLTKRPPFSLLDCPALSFSPLDEQRFPAVTIGRRALQIGGLAPAVLSGADEVCVAAFLDQEIRFDQIYLALQDVVEQASPCAVCRPQERNRDTVVEAVKWGRRKAHHWIRNHR